MMANCEYAGSEWIERSGLLMSDFGRRVADLLGEVYLGIYYIGRQALKVDWTGEKYISINIPDGGLATYDANTLARLVILAHRHNIRVSVRAAAYRWLHLEFMAVTHSGFFADRHPTIEEAVERIR